MFRPFNTLSVTIENKLKAKDSKFGDLLVGIDLKDFFDTNKLEYSILHNQADN